MNSEAKHNSAARADALDTGCGSAQLEDYFAGIEGELKQADRLVGDAVGNLVASFKHISTLTSSSQQIDAAIVQAARSTAADADCEPVGRLLVQQKVIAGDLEQEVNAVVTALQFGDLVAQLLAHTLTRVQAMRAALQRDEEDSSHDSHERRAWLRRAVMAANAASRSKPVVQHGMQKGEVELF